MGAGGVWEAVSVGVIELPLRLPETLVLATTVSLELMSEPDVADDSLGEAESGGPVVKANEVEETLVAGPGASVVVLESSPVVEVPLRTVSVEGAGVTSGPG